MNKRPDSFALMLLVVLTASLWSGWAPADRLIWFFELSPGWAGVAAMFFLRRRLPFSGLVYILMALLFVVLAVGAKYTYGLMPLFAWLKDEFALSRNYYDRFGHFMQGFVPAMIVREVLLRCSPLRPGKMLFFLTCCVCLAFSAFHELVEWQLATNFYSENPAEWLGMQGDQWDAQCDMLMALIGAISAQFVFARIQDLSLKKEGVL